MARVALEHRDYFKELIDLGCASEELGAVTWNPETRTVNVSGEVDLTRAVVPRLPFQFGTVGRYFWCSHSKLISLEGIPNEVGGDFWCPVDGPTSCCIDMSPLRHCTIRGALYLFGSNANKIHAEFQSNILSRVGGDDIMTFRQVRSNQIYRLANPSSIVSMHVSIPSKFSKLKWLISVVAIRFADQTITVQSIPDHHYDLKKSLVVSPGMIKRFTLPWFQSALDRPALRYLQLDESEILFKAPARAPGPFVGKRFRMASPICLSASDLLSVSDPLPYETISTHDECTITISDFFENDSNMMLDIMRHHA